MVRVGLVALLPLFGLGCDDAAEPEVTAMPSPQETASPSLPRIGWLDSNDGISPERWLASRAADADLPESAPQVLALMAVDVVLKLLDDELLVLDDAFHHIANRYDPNDLSSIEHREVA